MQTLKKLVQVNQLDVNNLKEAKGIQIGGGRQDKVCENYGRSPTQAENPNKQGWSKKWSREIGKG